VRASDEDRSPSYWLLPLMVLWANLHGGFTIGVALAVGFGIDAVLNPQRDWRRQRVMRWFFFALATLLVGCFTPYGYDSVVRTYLGFDLGNVLNYVGEWRPVNAYNDSSQVVVLLCLLALTLAFGVKIGIIRALMLGGLLYLSLRHVRGLPIFALTLPLIIARPLQQQFAFLRPLTDPLPLFNVTRSRWTQSAAVAVITIVITSSIASVYALLKPADVPAKNISPVAAVDYAIHAQVTGPVFNSFNFGGYLIFRGIPTFIDGRTLPFGKEFAQKYFDAVVPGDEQKLEELVDAYNASWTLFEPASLTASHFDRSPHWRRLYADDVAVIHVRR